MATNERTRFGAGIVSPDVGKATQFGQPNGNPIYPLMMATNQREFYRWCETIATLEELQAYQADETKPYNRRRYVEALLKCNKLEDFYSLTNQTHGTPKQTIEQETKISTLIVETK